MKKELPLTTATYKELGEKLRQIRLVAVPLAQKGNQAGILIAEAIHEAEALHERLSFD